MPLGNRHLSGYQCRSASVAIIQDLEQVLRLEPTQQVSKPVVKDQQLDTSEGIQEIGIGAVGVRDLGLAQEAGGAVVADI